MEGEILEGVTLKENCHYCGSVMGPTISYKLFTENKCPNCNATFQGNCFIGYAWSKGEE